MFRLFLRLVIVSTKKLLTLWGVLSIRIRVSVFIGLRMSHFQLKRRPFRHNGSLSWNMERESVCCIRLSWKVFLTIVCHDFTLLTSKKVNAHIFRSQLLDLLCTSSGFSNEQRSNSNNNTLAFLSFCADFVATLFFVDWFPRSSQSLSTQNVRVWKSTHVLHLADYERAA